MITFNLKDLIDYAIDNQDVYNVYFQKELNFLGVLIFIYHKNSIKVDFNDDKLNQLHKFMNGLVIQSLPSDKYKLLICPEESDNNFIYVYQYEVNRIITNHSDNSFNKEIKDKILDFKNYKNFKFKITSTNKDECLILVKYY